ncbi:hypothetical protein MKW92_021812 [Papaver armeniacum]|nr:hypothetical protein MKW92_021812 [Papaver armeniacum]
MRVKEMAISNVIGLLRSVEDLQDLLDRLKNFFPFVTKQKAAKIKLWILKAAAKLPGNIDHQISLCKKVVEWACIEKRKFLRPRVEVRLAELLMESKQYNEALILLSGSINDVRRLGDTSLLVDICLLQSNIHYTLAKLPKATGADSEAALTEAKASLTKAKAALTEAITAATSIMDVSPAQQGTIDLQCGILHAKEKDYKIGYSFFAQAFEAFKALKDDRALFSLKYSLMCKIMLRQDDDVPGIISAKAGLDYQGPELEAMKTEGIISAKAGLEYQGPELEAIKAVAIAHSNRSLKSFEAALRDYKVQIEADPILHRHLSSSYDTLLEENICKLIEPFSQVEIARISDLIELPVGVVKEKLSLMILDKKLEGTIDGVAECLIIFERPNCSILLSSAITTLDIIGKAVDNLYTRFV